jgi:hypothetical protein
MIFVEYNGKFLAQYKRMSAALDYINRKDLQDDLDNTLRLVDDKGNEYNPITGQVINH